MSHSIEQAAALVLRAVDYAEADRVVTLLTREHGRVSAIAKAARKSKRRFAGALEGFALISVDLTLGRGSLARLEAARVVGVFPRLLADLAALEAAGALLRLARELVPERVPEPEVFEALLSALRTLDSGAPPRQLRLACEARLLALTGFAPLLCACVVCGRRPQTEQVVLVDPARGGVVCRACGGGPERLSSAARAALQHALDGGPLASAGALLESRALSEAERLLSRFIGHVLQREHRSSQPLSPA